MFKFLLNLFDSRTEYQKQEDEKLHQQIREFCARHPSLRITPRCISVDPAEIVADPKFQEDLKRASKLIEE